MSGLGKISTLGERLDLELSQGASLLPVRHQLIDPDTGGPIDLSGCQVRAQIRHRALDSTVLVAFGTRIAPTPTDGWYEFWLTDEQTAGLPAGATIGDAASLHEWDLELEDAAGNVLRMFYGTVRVMPEVTRP